MTRINCIDPKELCREHLVAEYRELPRVFALAHKCGKPHPNAPKNYTLGTGHVIFFYDKLRFIANRHLSLIAEMQRRGYTTNFDGDVSHWETLIKNNNMWKDWVPNEIDMKINMDRIADRLSTMKGVK